ncbi:MAG: hypothetical protein RIT14_1249 [Pseudomonadota bacterium]|jgi:uncharacterized membrane protein YkvA (DUF1232 family)
MTLTHRLRTWARAIKRDILALWLAARDPRVPWAARALGLIVAAYALSPIDLIPDVIPVLGLLDDAILLPLGILLALRLIPPALREDLRARARDLPPRQSRAAAAVILALWAGAALLLILALLP